MTSKMMFVWTVLCIISMINMLTNTTVTIDGTLIKLVETIVNTLSSSVMFFTVHMVVHMHTYFPVHVWAILYMYTCMGIVYAYGTVILVWAGLSKLQIYNSFNHVL